MQNLIVLIRDDICAISLPVKTGFEWNIPAIGDIATGTPHQFLNGNNLP